MGTRILVADDDQGVADSLRMILESQGFHVRTVNDGLAAVEAARAFRPHLFLADVMMPGMNGIEAAQMITAAVPHCRVLLLSGVGETNELLTEAQSRGRDFAILPKPTHPAELLRHIRDLLDQRSAA